MTTLLQRVLAAGHRASTVVQGGAIVCRRGGSSCSLDATFGKSAFQIETADGVQVEHTDKDFIVMAAKYILNGSATKPQRGDRIESGGEVFEVLAPGNEKVFRECDPYGTRIRIHAKKVT